MRVRTGWADYVFEDNYKLIPLKEVEEFININNHLPNVPSANEVETQGLGLGEISKVQQEKIFNIFSSLFLLNGFRTGT